jgi:hypothetical protein
MALRLLSWLEAGRVYDTNGRHDIPGRSRSLWAAWSIFLERRTEADFQAWRDQQVWTGEKYLCFSKGERMATDWLGAPITGA